jgi:hypothetical protein
MPISIAFFASRSLQKGFPLAEEIMSPRRYANYSFQLTDPISTDTIVDL